MVAAAPRDVNKQVLAAAEARRVFVNAVDDPEHATAYLGGVVRRDGVTVAISTDGRAPALAGLLREALDAWLPGDLDEWMSAADEARRAWKAQGVPMEQRRPQLLETLNRLYAIGDAGPRSGRVGPARAPSRSSAPGPVIPSSGRCARSACSKEADLVLYDALVDVEALRRVTKAQCFCVGKRARRDSVPQETIHRLMIRAAKQGKRVVRLKGGDPFVFGRGGEEALALAMAGVPFEVVPGVTTAVAAPELAGIPVTHRGIASGFLVLAGHTLGGRRQHAAIGAAEYGVDGHPDGRRRARGPRVEADGARLVGRDAGGHRVRGVDAGRLDVDRAARARWAPRRRPPALPACWSSAKWCGCVTCWPAPQPVAAAGRHRREVSYGRSR